jgi:SpoVK/Ycf46/Vps4 family AAA+-type ATPase
LKITIFNDETGFFIEENTEKIRLFNIIDIYEKKQNNIRSIYYFFLFIFAMVIATLVLYQELSIVVGIAFMLVIWLVILIPYYIYQKFHSLLHIEYILDEEIQNRYAKFLEEFSPTIEKEDYSSFDFLRFLKALFSDFNFDLTLIRISGSIGIIGTLYNLEEKGFYNQEGELYPFIRFLPHALTFGSYEAINYSSLSIDVQSISYRVNDIEDEYEVIEQTWEYTTKTGKRDGRRKNNKEVYIIKAFKFIFYSSSEEIWDIDIIYPKYAKVIIHSLGSYLQFLKNEKKETLIKKSITEKLRELEQHLLIKNNLSLEDFFVSIEILFYFIIKFDKKIEITELSLVENVFQDFLEMQTVENIDFSNKGIKELLIGYFKQLYKYDALFCAHVIDTVEEIGLELIAIDGNASEVEVHKLTKLINLLRLLGPKEKSSRIKSREIPQNTCGIAENSKKSNQAKKIKHKETKNFTDYIEEIEQLIGLESVKLEVRNLINLAKINKIRKEKELPTVVVTYHMVFTGNPGTGKTTVARLLSKIYASMGVLSKGHLIETDRQGLVAEYVGQTATKTREIVEQAIGGVLFIDEAYSLSNKGSNDYGHEAIEILLKMMEDNRNDLIVIVAGYKHEMFSFLETNPGLKSRFKKVIEFNDFSIDELCDIFNLFCKKHHYILDDDANIVLREIIKKLYEKNKNNFGNARTVRNLFEKAIQQQANRIVLMSEVTKEELKRIQAQDLKNIKI